MYHELATALKKAQNKEDLNRIKLAFSRKHKLNKVPKTTEVFCNLTEGDDRWAITSKPVRTMSGVAPLAIMTKPFPCPTRAKCTFCPGGPGSAYGDTPKSYPGGSPCHRRAERNNYDPYLQVFNRLEHYALLNQDCSKTELIVMGGTFLGYPKAYRDEFITYALKAMNDFSEMFFAGDCIDIRKFLSFFELPSDIHDQERTRRVNKKLLALKDATTLEKEQLRNETSKVRCVTFCVETRSDCSREIHIDEVLRLGATRVELGVQTVYDKVLKMVERGNDDADNVRATQLLRDSFLKAGYHMMVGLPGSTKEMDVAMFKEIFSNQNYMPDALKIYPCMVFKGTRLYEQWKSGEFTPLTAGEAAGLIAEAKSYIPKWCRVMRVQRDIPTSLVEAGAERTNLRQYVREIMKQNGFRCSCIRCREPMGREVDWSNIKLTRTNYRASNGDEIFLSVDDVKNDILLGFLRLREPYLPFRKEITKRSMGVREIHVYGTAVNVNKKDSSEIQHKGIGTTLMEESEKIAAEEYDAKKMLVISGIGAREYFKNKFGYAQDGPYVSKTFI